MSLRSLLTDKKKSRWLLFVLAIVLAVDFFYGGVLTGPLLRRTPGVSGTLLLAAALALIHGASWMRTNQVTFRRILRRTYDEKVHVALAAVMIFAAWSRFSTLDWDLQHGQDGYEGHFIRAVGAILETGDLNHRYHEYPGLFLYLLLGTYLVGFVLAVGARLGTTLDNIPAGYFLKGCRGLVALFSFLNVPLTFRLGQLYLNRRVGLLAAALVCFSFLEIQTSQYIRPDIVLETLVIVALIRVLRVVREGTFKSTIWAGLAVGAATAVKYTGFLVYIPLAVACVLSSGETNRRIARILLGLAAVVAAYAVLSPYSFLDIPGFLYGVSEQAIYNTDPSLRPTENMAGYYTSILATQAIGYPALVLMFIGLARVLASPRREDIVLISFVFVYLAFFFVAPVQFDRFLLPCLPVLALFVGHGLEGTYDRLRSWLGRASGAVAGLVGVGIVLVPLVPTWRYIEARHDPSVRDEARDWIRRNLPPRSRVAVSRLGPSMEGTSFVSSRFVRFDGESYPVLRNFDFLVSAAIDSPETLENFTELMRFQPASAALGHEQVILQVPDALRPRYRKLALPSDQIRATYHSTDIPNLVDGSPATFWRGEEGELRQQIDIALESPVGLGKIVMTARRESADTLSALRVQISDEGRHFRPVERFVLYEPLGDDPDSVLVTLFLDSPAVRFVQILERRVSAGPVEIAELEMFERLPDASEVR